MWKIYRESYGFGGYQGVREFDDSEAGAIKLKYETGEIYKCTDAIHVSAMMPLANQKNGLNTYIDRNKPPFKKVSY